MEATPTKAEISAVVEQGKTEACAIDHAVEKLDREKPVMLEDGITQMTEEVSEYEEVIEESGETKKVKKRVKKKVVTDEVQKYMYSVMQRGARDENIKPFYVEQTVFGRVSIHTHDIGFDPFDVVLFLSYDLHLHPTESIDLNAPDTRSHCIGVLVKYTEEMNPRDMLNVCVSVKVEDEDGHELLIEKARKFQCRVNKLGTLVQGYTLSRFANFTIRDPDNWHAYAGTSFRFVRPLRSDDARFKDKVYRLVITLSEHRADAVIPLVSYKSTPLSLFSDSRKKRNKREAEAERRKKRRREVVVRNNDKKLRCSHSSKNGDHSPAGSSSDGDEFEDGSNE